MRTNVILLAAAVAALVPTACDRNPADPSAAGPGMVIAPASLTFSGWSPVVSAELALAGADASFNTAANEGCPFTSRDGKTFYMASNRPGGLGGLDIWVSTRRHVDDPWGPPVNVGAPVNSDADDFCPTLDRDGHRFFFVSRRAVAGACGGGDIYVTRLRDDGAYDEPENLGCQVNSAYEEFSPFPLPQAGGPPLLYFSSTRPGLGAGGDLYVSEFHGGAYGSPELVPGVNSEFDDGQPNVSRDGLELYFYSTRPDAGALGAADIYVSTRASVFDPWSTPANLGPNVNSAASETRPSLSWDGTTLYVGSSRPGGEGAGDIYVSTRERLRR